LRYTWIYNSASEFISENVLGKLDSDLLSPEDAERLTDIKRPVLATGVGTRQETFMTVSGEVRHYDLTVEPLRNLDGEIMGITCAATNITYRVQAEKALQESQRFIQQIADTTPNMIYLLELTQMRNTYLNSYARNFFGKTLEEIQARGAQFFAEVLRGCSQACRPQ
jgi:PAS domain-containing protein